MKKTGKKPTITVSLAPEIYKAIEQKATVQDRSMSQIARRLIEAQIEYESTPKPKNQLADSGAVQ